MRGMYALLLVCFNNSSSKVSFSFIAVLLATSLLPSTPTYSPLLAFNATLLLPRSTSSKISPVPIVYRLATSPPSSPYTYSSLMALRASVSPKLISSKVSHDPILPALAYSPPAPPPIAETYSPLLAFRTTSFI